MSAFKVGDQVVSVSRQHEDEEGTVVELTRGADGPFYVVDFYPNGRQMMFPEELELA